MAALKAGRYEAAASELSRVAEDDPDHAAAHYYLGYAYYLMFKQRPEEKDLSRKAAAELSHAYRLRPGFTPSWEGDSADR